MNFDKGNIGVKDGLSIHRQGLYKLSDIVEKLRGDPSSTDEASKISVSPLVAECLN
jgi:hypothetical protein